MGSISKLEVELEAAAVERRACEERIATLYAEIKELNDQRDQASKELNDQRDQARMERRLMRVMNRASQQQRASQQPLRQRQLPSNMSDLGMSHARVAAAIIRQEGNIEFQIGEDKTQAFEHSLGVQAKFAPSDRAGLVGPICCLEFGRSREQAAPRTPRRCSLPTCTVPPEPGCKLTGDWTVMCWHGA